MSDPYRDAPRTLACPRCRELLAPLRDGIAACSRCAGLWLDAAVIAEAFDDPNWPGGRADWWRNALPCPECGTTIMNARQLGEVVVDHCARHGAWLDRGELARLTNSSVDDLTLLRERLAVTGRSTEELAARRAKLLAAEEARRAEEAAAEVARAAAIEHERLAIESRLIEEQRERERALVAQEAAARAVEAALETRRREAAEARARDQQIRDEITRARDAALAAADAARVVAAARAQIPAARAAVAEIRERHAQWTRHVAELSQKRPRDRAALRVARYSLEDVEYELQRALGNLRRLETRGDDN